MSRRPIARAAGLASLVILAVALGWIFQRSASVPLRRTAPPRAVAPSPTRSRPASTDPPMGISPRSTPWAVDAGRPGPAQAHAGVAGVLVRGLWGSGPGQFGRSAPHEGNPEMPMALCSGLPGDVTVLDQVNRRVQRFRDGRLVGMVPVRGEGTQDVAVLPGGGTAVLDRLGDPSVQLVDADGRTTATLPLTGGPIREGGGVTGLFVDPSGIYVEREHQELVRLADLDGRSDPDRTTLWGRPSRDGRLLLRAAITNREGGEVTVVATARTSDGSGWSRAVPFDASILHVVLLDSDRRGRVYVGADTGTEAPDPPYGILGEKITVVRLGPDGTPDGRIDLPPSPPSDETFRPLTLDDDGTVYALAPGAAGLDVVGHPFSP